MYLDANDSLNLRKNKVYEPVETALIKYLLKPTDVCLDIGAHIGYFTIIMAKLCSKVYAFEPDWANFDVLKQNIKGMQNVTVFPLAVAEDDKDRLLYTCLENSGMTRIY